MARINLTVQYDDIGINVSRQGQQAVLHIADVVIGSETRPDHPISADPNNDLKLGSDNKLVSQPTDTDYLAYYIISRG